MKYLVVHDLSWKRFADISCWSLVKKKDEYFDIRFRFLDIKTILENRIELKVMKAR